jgi:hypothetical protein
VYFILKGKEGEEKVFWCEEKVMKSHLLVPGGGIMTTWSCGILQEGKGTGAQRVNSLMSNIAATNLLTFHPVLQSIRKK